MSTEAASGRLRARRGMAAQGSAACLSQAGTSVFRIVCWFGTPADARQRESTASIVQSPPVVFRSWKVHIRASVRTVLLPTFGT
jgi:hypothetical protein